MDKRYSKENMLLHIKELEERIEAVFDAGLWGIAHVGAANYASRQLEAEQRLDAAMWGDNNG